MNDPIDRQAAIEAMSESLKRVFPEHRQIAEKCLNALPSAQPERKKGRWEMKPDPYGFFEEIPVCSECGHTTEMRKTYNFCPNCGADMRGE